MRSTYEKNSNRHSRPQRPQRPQRERGNFVAQKKSPMPDIDSVIKPIHSAEAVAWWEKNTDNSSSNLTPDGKFVRLIWNEEEQTHYAVCNNKYNKGIVVFIYGRTPELGDYVKIVDQGKSTCRGVIVSKYEDEIDRVIEEINSSDEDDTIEDIVFEIAGEIIENSKDDISDQESMLLHGILCMGVAKRLKYGKPSYERKIHEKDEDEDEDVDGNKE